MSNQNDLVTKLRHAGHHPSWEGEFLGVDLRGADLSGISLSFVSLAHAQLDGANLTKAHFTQVDLRCASFNGTLLEKARFELVDTGSASFVEAKASNSTWRRTDLTGADFSNTNLRNSSFHGSTLQSARLDGADLSHGMMVNCAAEDASFRETRFRWLNTSGSTFRGSDFTDARQFFLSREIIVEILRHHLSENLERAQLLGAFAMMPKWCYPEWKKILETQPEHRDLVFEIFRAYPEAGLIEALNEGRAPDPSEEDSDTGKV